MSNVLSLEELTTGLQQEHNFSNGSISLLSDKGFEQRDFQKLYEALSIPDQTFGERRETKSWIDIALDRGDSEEITTGRYNKNVVSFRDISSEQALVQGRMKFSSEHMIRLAYLVSRYPQYRQFIERPFNEDEQVKLRNIYQRFRTKDYLAAQIIEGRTNHDVVAANTWVIIRGQQSGLDEDWMRTG